MDYRKLYETLTGKPHPVSTPRNARDEAVMMERVLKRSSQRQSAHELRAKASRLPD